MSLEYLTPFLWSIEVPHSLTQVSSWAQYAAHSWGRPSSPCLLQYWLWTLWHTSKSMGSLDKGIVVLVLFLPLVCRQYWRHVFSVFTSSLWFASRLRHWHTLSRTQRVLFDAFSISSASSGSSFTTYARRPSGRLQLRPRVSVTDSQLFGVVVLWLKRQAQSLNSNPSEGLLTHFRSATNHLK